MTNHPFLAAKIVIFLILLQSLCQNLHFSPDFDGFCHQGDMYKHVMANPAGTKA